MFISAEKLNVETSVQEAALPENEVEAMFSVREVLLAATQSIPRATEAPTDLLELLFWKATMLQFT